MKELLSFWTFYFIKYSDGRQHLENWTPVLPEVMEHMYSVESKLISVTGERRIEKD
jgi:hypothetical protein